MQHYTNNPRRITTAQMERLKTTLAELGDLSGIVHDLNSDQVVGGNQRIDAMNLAGAQPTITQRFDPPTAQGTMALGYLEWQGERFAYRVVKWTPEQCQRANIVANAGGGNWDWSILASDFDAAELATLGLGQDALAAMNEGADALRGMMQTDEKIDPMAEWQGMPEFHQEDLTAFKSIVVHFDSPDNVKNFSELVEQAITEKTKSIWYPRAQKTNMTDIYVEP